MPRVAEILLLLSAIASVIVPTSATSVDGSSTASAASCSSECQGDDGHTCRPAMQTRPLHPVFGVVVSGITVGEIANSKAHVETLRQLIHKHRLVLIRNEGDHDATETMAKKVTPEDQLKLSRQLGPIESTFYKHPASPDPDIFRVSNDERMGCTNVGRSGWHLDGTFLEEPFAYQTMHFPHAIDGGATEFVPLRDLLYAQPPDVQAEWRKLTFLVRSSGAEHRLVWKHPVTAADTMLFHLGGPFCGGWLKDATGDAKPSYEPPQGRIAEIQRAIDAARAGDGDTSPLVLTMQWRDDDFAILDNMALAHYAVPDTQADASRAGLRVLHRTTTLLPKQFRGAFPWDV